MPVNKNMFIRLRVINDALRQRVHDVDLDYLQSRCTDALNISGGISRRTIQADLQFMRNELKAPIRLRKPYNYSDPNYNIWKELNNMPDSPIFKNLVNVFMAMQLYENYPFLQEGNFMDEFGELKKLQKEFEKEGFPDHLCIQADTNLELKGIEHLPVLFEAVIRKKIIEIKYKPYNEDKTQNLILHPQLIKENSNRWYVVGFENSKYFKILNIPVDRMLSIKISNEASGSYINHPENYYDDVVGITKYTGISTVEVCFRAYGIVANLIMTKPIHPSQSLLVRNEEQDYSEFSIKVKPNIELENELLHYGESIELLKPETLRQKMADHAKAIYKRYHH